MTGAGASTLGNLFGVSLSCIYAEANQAETGMASDHGKALEAV